MRSGSSSSFAGAEAYQAVVGLGVLFVGEVRVVGGHELHVVFAGELYELRLDAALQLVGLVVGAGTVALWRCISM